MSYCAPVEIQVCLQILCFPFGVSWAHKVTTDVVDTHCVVILWLDLGTNNTCLWAIEMFFGLKYPALVPHSPWTHPLFVPHSQQERQRQVSCSSHVWCLERCSKQQLSAKLWHILLFDDLEWTSAAWQASCRCDSPSTTPSSTGWHNQITAAP